MLICTEVFTAFLRLTMSRPILNWLEDKYYKHTNKHNQQSFQPRTLMCVAVVVVIVVAVVVERLLRFVLKVGL